MSSDVQAPDSKEAPFDTRMFRDVLGHYPTGVVAVTGVSSDGTPQGMVVGTFSSVSLDPPMVSFMPTKGSGTYATLRESSEFCVNVLAHDQRAETRILSQRDPQKFDKVKWSPSEEGLPQLDGAVAYIRCARTQEIEAGDHLIVLCEVRAVEVARPVTPLLFFQGGYGGFSSTGMAAYVDLGLISAARLADVARPQLLELVDRFECEAVALIQITDHDHTIGAAARAASVSSYTRLGVRIPIIPPLGEAAVAWSDEYTEKWLSRIFPPDPEVIAKYRARVEDVRSRGYALEVVPVGREAEHAQLTEALHEYALGELTPARDRAVRGAIAAAADFFGTDIPSPDSGARVISIAVPVFDPTASSPTNSGLVLRLSQLPEGSVARTHEHITALRAAADEVTRALAGPNSRDFERYVESGLRDSA